MYECCLINVQQYLCNSFSFIIFIITLILFICLFQTMLDFINLVVRRLNVYVGKERMLVFPVVILVAMTQKAVSMVVRGNRNPK